MKTCKSGCGGKMKEGGKVTTIKKMMSGGIKKKYQDGGPTIEDLDRQNRREFLKGKSAKIGLGTVGAGITSIIGKKIADTVKKKREGNKEVKGLVKNLVKKAKSTRVMQNGGKTTSFTDDIATGLDNLFRKTYPFNIPHTQTTKALKAVDDYLTKGKGKMSAPYEAFKAKVKKTMKVPNKKQDGGATKKMQKGGSTTKVTLPMMGMPMYSSNPRSEQGRILKNGGSTTNRAVAPGCRGGMVKDASGKCVMERKMQKGVGLINKDEYNKIKNTGVNITSKKNKGLLTTEEYNKIKNTGVNISLKKKLQKGGAAKAKKTIRKK
jgi:hypothetical protein